MSETTEYWEERLQRESDAYERRIEALEARLADAREALEWIAVTDCTGSNPDHTCLWLKREGRPHGTLCPKCRAEELLSPLPEPRVVGSMTVDKFLKR